MYTCVSSPPCHTSFVLGLGMRVSFSCVCMRVGFFFSCRVRVGVRVSASCATVNFLCVHAPLCMYTGIHAVYTRMHGACAMKCLSSRTHSYVHVFSFLVLVDEFLCLCMGLLIVRVYVQVCSCAHAHTLSCACMCADMQKYIYLC